MHLHNCYNHDLCSPTNTNLSRDTFYKIDDTPSSQHSDWLALEEEVPYYSLDHTDFDFTLDLFKEDYRSFFDHGFVYSHKTDVYDQVLNIEHTKIPINAYPTQFEED